MANNGARIDVHCHSMTPAYRNAIIAAAGLQAEQ